LTTPSHQPDLFDNIPKFREQLVKAIEFRKGILDPENPLLILPIDLQGEETIIKELRLLENILLEFNKLFL
jgi:hypothetical protein